MSQRILGANDGSVRELPLIGFQDELFRLRKAIRRRESLLVFGARGSGKTRLIRAALQEPGCDAVYVHSPAVLHDFLISLARALVAAGHRPTLGVIGRNSDFDRVISGYNSVHLKGILWTAIEKEPVMMVLDEIQGAGTRNYRFLQRVFHTKDVGVIAAARDYRCLDSLSRLFWDPRMIINVPPLTQVEARTLFDQSVGRLCLNHLDLEQFRDQVLESARGNPAEIIEMCKLAAQPQYRHGTHVKFAPLRIDAIMRLGASY